ncbi:MAG: fumarylacetoacetate hydrolase family protein [Planctomycetes bacterium]|nr:fumarylacetoacetate hydrolase family protein [Planctomycetota bacterium]
MSIPQPRQILCVGRNYAAHAAELGNAVPSTSGGPLLFWKPVGCLTQDACQLPTWPEGETEVHYEGEIVLVLGRDLGPGTPDLPVDPWDAIESVAAGLDLSDRTLQKKEPQWVRAKGFADAGVLGPATPRPTDPLALRVRTWKNDELVQDGTSDLLLFPFRGLIRYVHGFLRLYAGDVIYTGTPAGVGRLAPADRVRVRIDAGEASSELSVSFSAGPPIAGFPRES